MHFGLVGSAHLSPIAIGVCLPLERRLEWLISCVPPGDGLALATASVVAKTLVLYAIMVTGSIWEREVFGRYLFAPAFFWDVVSILVLALHTAYLGTLAFGWPGPRQQMGLALAAYAAYAVNATQFLLKLRAARLGQDAAPAEAALGLAG